MKETHALLKLNYVITICFGFFCFVPWPKTVLCFQWLLLKSTRLDGGLIA